MFVSVMLDPGGIDSAKALAQILARYGFKKVQRALWESTKLGSSQLAVMKREIDSATDYYDTLRIYQFPFEGSFVLTELKQKKWRKCVIRSEK